MSVTANTGGSAFPTSERVLDVGENYKVAQVITSGGMTLRDYFAAHALSGMTGHPYPDAMASAKAAFNYADAMLTVRDCQQKRN
jgi:hypothetical protein